MTAAPAPGGEMPFPIPRAEARLDVAHAYKTIVRLERKQARLAAQIAEVAGEIAQARQMLRIIFGVYPDVADEGKPAQKSLAELFGSDPDFTGGQDSVAFVRQGRGGT